MDSPPSPSLFSSYLLPGERILWTGQPKQGFAFRSLDIFLIPFSLLWTGMVISFFVAVWQEPAAGPPGLILILFLVIGIYFTIGRFIHDAALRKATSYAVSDQRLLFRRWSRFASLDIARLPKLELHEHGDLTGTIGFESGPSFFNYGRAGGFDFWIPSVLLTSQFFRIENPRKVYQLIRDNAAR